MRLRTRSDSPVSADLTAACELCGDAVPVLADGSCELGHHVTSPEMVAAASQPAAADLDAAAPEAVTEPLAPPEAAYQEPRVGNGLSEMQDLWNEPVAEATPEAVEPADIDEPVGDERAVEEPDADERDDFDELLSYQRP